MTGVVITAELFKALPIGTVFTNGEAGPQRYIKAADGMVKNITQHESSPFFAGAGWIATDITLPASAFPPTREFLDALPYGTRITLVSPVTAVEFLAYPDQGCKDLCAVPAPPIPATTPPVSANEVLRAMAADARGEHLSLVPSRLGAVGDAPRLQSVQAFAPTKYKKPELEFLEDLVGGDA